MNYSILLFAIGLVVPSLVSASLGDDLPEFQRCLKYCDILSCGNLDLYPDVSQDAYEALLQDEYVSTVFEKPPLPLHLTLVGWDCYSDCDYQCQMIITDYRISTNQEVYQFHGKWPFIRILGIQELFSVLFSIGNFIPNYLGFKLLWKHYNIELKKNNQEFVILYWTYMLVAVASMCAWTASTLFHWKDTWNRERMDYLFAGMTVLTGMYAILVRFFKLYKMEKTLHRKVLAVICIFLYFSHVTRLLLSWSYSYNMRANVVCGLIQNFLWVYLSCSQFNKIRNKKLPIIGNIKNKEYNWTLIPIALVMSVVFGMLFELFDFPPYFQLLDAHAMWHFVTIWPYLWWYPYMVKDSQGLMELKFD